MIIINAIIIMSVRLIFLFIRRLGGVESYHHLQQRQRHYGGGAAGRTASIQGTLFIDTKCQTTKQYLLLYVFILQWRYGYTTL